LFINQNHYGEGRVDKRSKVLIEQVREVFRERPTKVATLIKILNSKTQEELEELEIEYRTETIL